MTLAETETLEDLKQAIKIALSRCDSGREEWIAGTIELAQALCRGKDRFDKNNNDFGAWLDANGFAARPNRHDRGALIQMGRMDPQYLADALRTIDRTSWQHTWDKELRPLVGSLPHVRTTPLPSNEIAKSEQNVEQKPSNVVALRSDGRSVRAKRGHVPEALRKRKRGTEFATLAGAESCWQLTRLLTNSRNATDVWALILESIDAGFYAKVEKSLVSTSLRWVFPALNGLKDFAQSYDVTSAKDRARIREIVIPAIRENLAACLADPDRVEGIVKAYAMQQRRAQIAANTDKEEAPRRAQLFGGEQEIRYCGRRLWPLTPEEQVRAGYDYTTLAYALRWVHDLQHDLSFIPGNETAYAQARHIRTTILYPAQYLDIVLPPDQAAKAGGMFRMIHQLCNILQETQGQGEMTPTPLINDIRGGRHV